MIHLLFKMDPQTILSLVHQMALGKQVINRYAEG
jgi:hypothetical protein